MPSKVDDLDREELDTELTRLAVDVRQMIQVRRKLLKVKARYPRQTSPIEFPGFPPLLDLQGD